MKNRKVGILNFHYSTVNYGAVLQAAALEDFVRRLGYDVEHINYIPQEDYELIFDRLKYELKCLIKKITRIELPNSVFDDFRAKYINETNKIVRRKKLSLISDNYSSVIVGSDQVWRSEYTVNDTEVYFLNFLGSNTKRISYAASFGTGNWVSSDKHILKSKKELTESVQKLINEFNFISVRESSGVEICKNTFSVNAEHVLDPTLLNGADFFYNIIENRCTKNYHDRNAIVYYKLDQDECFVDYIKYLERELSSDSYDLYRDNEGNFREVEEWLTRIHHSELVVTDSFHCICLAILFEKEFIYYPNNHNRGMDRLTSLLSMLNIEGRIYGIDVKENTLPEKRLNYKVISNRLSELREFSKSYLLNALRS